MGYRSSSWTAIAVVADSDWKTSCAKHNLHYHCWVAAAVVAAVEEAQKATSCKGPY